jgi:hypothetical protein
LSRRLADTSQKHRLLSSLAWLVVAVFTLAVGISSGVAAEDESSYDPYEGIEEDGRIPKVELPKEILRPEHWRYVPEGKIKPGNVLQRFLVSTFIVPLFRFEQDVGAGAGIALTDIDFREQRRREFLGLFLSYTTEGQQKYRAIWRRRFYHLNLPEGGVAYEDRSNWTLNLGYEKTLTRRFFGFGADTKEHDETSYTDELQEMRVGAEVAFPEPGGDFIGRAEFRGEHHAVSNGRVSNQPDTGDVFPELVSDADGFTGGWMQLGLAYDTRDSQH